MNGDWKRYATITRSAPLRLVLQLMNQFILGRVNGADALRTLAEAEAPGMLHSAGSTANVERMPHVTVLTGFRRGARDSPPDLLDQFFSNRWPTQRVIR